MVDIFGFEFEIPTFGLNSASLLMIGILLGLIGFGCFVLWLVIDARLYNRRVIIFENVSGLGYQPILKDKAKVIKVGNTGEEILWLKKSRVYRSSYNRKMGKNTYWFAIGQDGYWYNFLLGDLDAKKGMLDIEPVDRDLRLTYVSVAKQIKEEYNNLKFMDKYGTHIMNGLFLIIMLVGIWFLLEEIGEIMRSSQQVVEAARLLAESNKNILSSLNNICSTSGIVAVG
jgi:hypothetical protein